MPGIREAVIRRQTNPLRCSFCKRTDRQVKAIVTDGVGKPAICNECVAKAYKRVTEYLEGTNGKSGHHR